MSRSGIAAQFGLVAETTYGTAVTVSRFLPFASESLALDIERIEAEGIRAGRGVLHADDWYAGRRMVEGDFTTEAYDRSTAILFAQALGGSATTGTGPTYTHTITPAVASLFGRSMTIQVGRPDVGGTVRPFTYTGCKVQSLELSCAAGELAQLNVGIVGRNETTATALATASYAASMRAFTFIQGAVTIGGSAANVKSFTLNIENAYDTDRLFLGSDLMSEPIINGLTEITGTASMEFESLAQYERYSAGVATFAMVATFTAGAHSMTITLNVRAEPTSVNVSGRDVLQLDLPFKAVGTTDAAACTVVIVNADAAV